MEERLRGQKLREQRKNGPGILWPSLKVGAASGAAGLLISGTTSILSASKTPKLWMAAGTLQYTLLGSSYWAVRSAYLQTQLEDELTADTKAYVSAGSAATAAVMVGATLRGRSSIFPGLFFGGLAGYGGQRAYDYLDRENSAKHYAAVEEKLSSKPREPVNEDPLWKRVLDMKYSPVTVLSNEDYRKVLEGRVLKMDVEIAVLEDDIRALKGEVGQTAEAKEVELIDISVPEAQTQSVGRRRRSREG